MRKILCTLVVAAFLAGVIGVSFAASLPDGDNNGKKLTVFTKFKLKSDSNPGVQNRTKMALIALAGFSRMEPGCISWDAHVNVGTDDIGGTHPYTIEDKNYYMIYENWRSSADWEKHKAMSHTQVWNAFFARYGEGLPEVSTYEMIESPSNAVFRGTLPGTEKYTLSATVRLREKHDSECADVIPPSNPPPPAPQVPIGDCVDRGYKEMLALVPLTHLEPGCINYEMHVGLDAPNYARNYRHYLFYENWYNFNVWKYDHMGSSYLVNWFLLVPILTEAGPTGALLEGWKQLTMIK